MSRRLSRVSYPQALAIWRHRLEPPERRAGNVSAMHAVAAASARLRDLASAARESARDKQEPAGTGIPTGSTDRLQDQWRNGGCSPECA